MGVAPPKPAPAGGSGDNAFLAGKDLRMLALCEVVNVPSSQARLEPAPCARPEPRARGTHESRDLTLVPLAALRKSGVIWVAPDEECVVTRFLFAFPNGTAHFGLSSIDDAFQKDVRACIESLHKRG